ncbi:hypothetical protein KSP35_13260 [Aquihabitans sp. G128]|uniref:homing endonuclease associated repeat-containing protein n=1 Tax=Aquihabitans sp. G128 TaxID=2849779 RepID=UPI001C2112B3|nr:hypothetical protein [Aquihabitans sp. G128]QXC59371.1 hypothetical protein KSP35_13260 [Aquihabitans sp. G128]
MARHWTDGELLDHVRAAAEACGQPLRIVQYRAWARQSKARPSESAVVHHLGPWGSVLEQAGLVNDRRYRVWR